MMCYDFLLFIHILGAAAFSKDATRLVIAPGMQVVLSGSDGL